MFLSTKHLQKVPSIQMCMPNASAISKYNKLTLSSILLFHTFRNPMGINLSLICRD